ncbi:TerC family protein [Chengkuizengella axinellae]|uniref:TerC family protein n=1 Tax=Chengkuizengella axinellae TaxID=3064388 RepID=A0ABT9IUX5_9BACL|nr:TerC family protein [Chengkuizengella sp. 2205SS18-9]MDP5273117.1 TerC family protein [Chengkuizengella sp. 2205SS18-9]
MVENLLILVEIVIINIVLSGDNAIVIALASKNLPQHQQKKAVWWGAAGAVILRLVLTVGAVFLLEIPYIQAVGSALLLYIAISLLINDNDHSVKEVYSLGAAIWTIVVADFVMSLDNVLAIAAIAQDDYILLFLGIGMSIPLIVWGSTFFMKLLEKFSIFVYLGAGILGYTAGEMLLNDQKAIILLKHAHHSVHWFIPAFCTVFVLLAGVLFSKKS